MASFWSNNKRYFIEFVLIFSSVVLAFYFEDYRENRRDEEEYRKALLNFREDLHRDIITFRFTHDTASVARNRSYPKPFLLEMDSIIRTVSSMVWDGDEENNDSALYIFNSNIGPIMPWRSPSKNVIEVNKYPNLVAADSIRHLLANYDWIGSRSLFITTDSIPMWKSLVTIITTKPIDIVRQMSFQVLSILRTHWMMLGVPLFR